MDKTVFSYRYIHSIQLLLWKHHCLNKCFDIPFIIESLSDVHSIFRWKTYNILRFGLKEVPSNVNYLWQNPVLPCTTKVRHPNTLNNIILFSRRFQKTNLNTPVTESRRRWWISRPRPAYIVYIYANVHNRSKLQTDVIRSTKSYSRDFTIFVASKLRIFKKNTSDIESN